LATLDLLGKAIRLEIVVRGKLFNSFSVIRMFSIHASKRFARDIVMLRQQGWVDQERRKRWDLTLNGQIAVEKVAT
jgi:hypothetical protein